MQVKEVLHWLYSASGGLGGRIAVLFIIQAILGISSVIFALLLKGFVDSAVAGEGSGAAVFFWLLAGCIIIMLCCSFLSRFFTEWASSLVENNVKKRLFSVLLSGDFARVSKIHSGEWMNRLTSDAAVAAGAYVSILPGVGALLIRLAGVLGVIIFFVPWFAWLLIPGGIAGIAACVVLRRKMENLHREVQEADGNLRVFLSERLAGLMVVKSFGRGDAEAQGAGQYLKSHLDARLKRGFFSAAVNSGFNAVVYGLLLITLVWGGIGILHGAVGYGTFMAVMTLAGMIMGPVAGISGMVPRFYSMTASARRLAEAESFSSDSSNADDFAISDAFYRDSFTAAGVRSLTFSYPDCQETVLDNVTFSFRKGEIVGISGRSGCGKSTLLKLLMGLYPVEGGYVCSKDGEKPGLSALRGLCAYAGQDDALMQGRVRDVVAFGKSGCDEEIWAALNAACAAGFVHDLSDGLDTELGEKGGGLSAGQLQRLAIARCIFSKRGILLLDEAASGVESETEKEIIGNLRAMKEKTVIIVSHRKSALKLCDRIYSFSDDEE